jgi:phospholipid/cholesterol/gamma-HCH transport system substrate-binding protein
MRVSHLGAKVAALGVFTVACVGIFVYLFGAAGGKLRLSTPYQVTVQVPNAFQLVPNADVRAAGVKIGTVNAIESDGPVARVKLELQDRYAPLYRDARVLVRTKTLVGENYLDIEPGTPRSGRLPDKATLPARNGEDAVQLDQILSAMDARTRATVRANLQNLGGGLRGRGSELNRIFAAARPTVATGGRAIALLDGQREQVARIVQNTGRVMAAIGDRKADVRVLATSARRTAEAVAARDERLKAFLEELPGTLTQARASTTRLGAFAGRATPVAADLRAAARDLGPVVRDLGPAATGTRRLLTELPPLLRTADPLLQRLGTFSRSGTPTVAALDAFLREVNPAISFLKPYAPEFGSFFANTGSALTSRDAVGNVGRVHAQIGESSLDNLGEGARQALDALLKAGALDTYHQVRNNSYPEPGTVGSPGPQKGAYPRLQPKPPTP